MTGVTGTHTQHEDHAWTINIGDHPKRADSPGYLRSRKLMIELVKQCQPWFFGPPAYQDHHGGGWWLKDDRGFFMVLAPAGLEWSGQFACAPDRLDLLRQMAQRLFARFPETIPAYEALGYTEAREILDTPITDAAGVARWTDSILNASVPLPALAHTGILPKGGGFHSYPKPIVDLEFLKRSDFVLWVTDPKGRPVAVAPVAPRGSGDGRVEVVYASPGSQLHRQHHAAHAKGERLILPPDHPLAQKAFAKQQ